MYLQYISRGICLLTIVLSEHKPFLT